MYTNSVNMHHEDNFKQKLDLAIQKRPSLTGKKLWIDITVYSLLISVIVSLYYFLQQGTFSIRIANRMIGDVSMLLMGLSMALSGLCYYWNFADHFIVYRKQLGVIGFIYALIHTIIALFFLPRSLPFLVRYLEPDNILMFTTALIAIVIYLGMVIISTKKVIQILGGLLWRRLLRIGYIAYFLSVLHFALVGYDRWLEWLTGKDEKLLPHFGLIIFMYGSAVLVLRIILWISHINKSPATIESHEKNSLSF